MNHYSDWELVGECGVDSGQIIVVDPCYVISDESDLDKFKESGDYNDVDATYEELLKERDVRNSNNLTDAFKFGIVTNTGFGDGEYNVYIKKEKQGDWGERVSELKIVFIGDEEEEEEDEY